MISAPTIHVQCDQRPGGERCRRAAVIHLPGYDSTRERTRALFLALEPEWRINADGQMNVFCPNCRRIAEAKQLEARDVS